jgi:hypothetical protein
MYSDLTWWVCVPLPLVILAVWGIVALAWSDQRPQY